MPLDPNIILQAGRYPKPDYATTLAQVGQIRGQQQQQQLRDLQIADVQRQNQERLALSSAVDPQGNIDPVAVRNAYARSGNPVGAQTFEKSELENATALHKFISPLLESVKDQASLDAVRAQLAGNPATAPGASKLPQVYDEAGAAEIDRLKEVGKTVAERIATLTASPEYQGKVAGAKARATFKTEKELRSKLLSPEEEAQQIRIDQAKESARAASYNVQYDPETIDFMADQALAGDKSVFAQLGFGRTGGANRAALRNAVTKKGTALGMSGKDIAALNAEYGGIQAGERTLGTRTANIAMASTEAQMLIPLAVTASENVDRTQFPTLNAVLLATEQGIGGENVVRLGIATNSLINVYARAINPTGVPTVSDKEHARELLSTAWAKGQYKAGLDQLNQELIAAVKSPGAVREEFRSAITGKPKANAEITPPSAGATAAPQGLPPEATAKLKAGVVTTFGNGQKWTIQNGQPMQVQ